MDKKRKDKKLLLFMILTTAIGGINILLKKAYVILFPYLLLAVTAILSIYYAYAFSKWHNKRHAYYHERDGKGGEPSEWFIFGNKIGGWLSFGAALFLSLLSNMLF